MWRLPHQRGQNGYHRLLQQKDLNAELTNSAFKLRISEVYQIDFTICH